ncbi:unannotated protein [freshwater metagenome]|uniref:Unannotated protein n=1 Tax=freshwater metagenome TaxID=449393 RepID=A0A6J6V906_9ZZZZ
MCRRGARSTQHPRERGGGGEAPRPRRVPAAPHQSGVPRHRLPGHDPRERCGARPPARDRAFTGRSDGGRVRMGRAARRRGHAPSRGRRGPRRHQPRAVHLGHYRCTQRSDAAPPRSVWDHSRVGPKRRAGKGRPVLHHQPVLSHLGAQDRRARLPHRGRDHAPAGDVRSGGGDGARPGRADHGAARSTDHLPDAVGAPSAQRVRPRLAPIGGHRRGVDTAGARGTNGARARLRQRDHRVRHHRDDRCRDHVPAGRRDRADRRDVRSRGRRGRAAHHRRAWHRATDRNRRRNRGARVQPDGRLPG